MKETDLVTVQWTLTVHQVRYLRRKLHDWAGVKLTQAKKDARAGRVNHHEDSSAWQDSVMLEALAADLQAKL